MPSHSIEYCNINNFKSINSLQLKCKRVNVFVGQPNVGKSNILEAISTFSLPYLDISKDADANDYIRYNDFVDLLSMGGEDKTPTIKIDPLYEYKHDYTLTLNIENDNLNLEITNGSLLEKGYPKESRNWPLGYESLKISISTNGEYYIKGELNKLSPIKLYKFRDVKDYKSKFNDFLLPPFGMNLLQQITSNEEVRSLLKGILDTQKLDIVIDRRNNLIEIQKKEGDFIYKIPYSSIADTIRRFVFHYAAIKTNKDSVLLFEEPEAHSYPPYIRQLAEEIVEDESNQYFIATHSPYLLNTFIQEMEYDDLGIFITWYEDYQTKARELTAEEIAEISDYGVDLFFNIDSFAKDK